MQLLQQLLSERESMRNGDAEREHAIRVFEAELTAAVDALGLEVRECVCGEGGGGCLADRWQPQYLVGDKDTLDSLPLCPDAHAAQRQQWARTMADKDAQVSLCVWPCFMKGHPLAT